MSGPSLGLILVCLCVLSVILVPIASVQVYWFNDINNLPRAIATFTPTDILYTKQTVIDYSATINVSAAYTRADGTVLTLPIRITYPAPPYALNLKNETELNKWWSSVKNGARSVHLDTTRAVLEQWDPVLHANTQIVAYTGPNPAGGWLAVLVIFSLLMSCGLCALAAVLYQSYTNEIPGTDTVLQANMFRSTVVHT